MSLSVNINQQQKKYFKYKLYICINLHALWYVLSVITCLTQHCQV